MTLMFILTLTVIKSMHVSEKSKFLSGNWSDDVDRLQAKYKISSLFTIYGKV